MGFAWLASTRTNNPAATVTVIVAVFLAAGGSADAFRPLSLQGGRVPPRKPCGMRDGGCGGGCRSGTTTATATALFSMNSTKTENEIGPAAAATTTATDDDDDDSWITGAFEKEQEEEDGGDDDDFAPFDDDRFPGRDENGLYECAPSVAFWRDFRNNPYDPDNADDVDALVRENLRDMAAVARRFAAAGPGAAAHFGRHLGRTAYFLGNGLLGNLAYGAVSDFSDRVSGGGGDRNNNGSGGVNTLFARRDGGSSRWNPVGITPAVSTRLVLEALLCYEQDYFDHIATGAYRAPWDVLAPTGPSSKRGPFPLGAIDQTTRYVREAVGTLGRLSRGTDADKGVAFFSTNTDGATKTNSNNNHNDKLYPGYYQTAFHYQGDGWMSSGSARVYETSTETLFLGRQDAMQRTSLPPLVGLSRKHFGAGAVGADRRDRPMRVLEVACGTGRFLTFVRDNLPRTAECTAIDLSPFYLEKAAENDADWRRAAAAAGGGGGRRGAAIAPATLAQAKAEDLPFGDGSFDAVVCVYLFHELPRHVRAKAAAEMARVVAPGGVVVLTDSLQKGDRPALDAGLPGFTRLNEPFYVDYVNDDLGAHFTATGLVPRTKILRSNTKSLSFDKPGELPP